MNWPLVCPVWDQVSCNKIRRRCVGRLGTRISKTYYIEYHLRRPHCCYASFQWFRASWNPLHWYCVAMNSTKRYININQEEAELSINIIPADDAIEGRKKHFQSTYSRIELVFMLLLLLILACLRCAVQPRHCHHNFPKLVYYRRWALFC